MENFDGKVMASFDSDGIPHYRKILAADLINNVLNTEDSAKIFEEETYE
jgi:hypothetical protein